MKLKKPITFETAFDVFIATEVIGEGGSGRVYKAADESGEPFAVKLLDPEKATREKIKRFKNEILFCSKNCHRNIITVTDSGVLNSGEKSAPFYVMPYCTTSLRRLMDDGIAAGTILPYFAQILDGVEAAHLQGVFHRDLKPENILYDEIENRLLIADFGIAHFEQECLYTTVETKPSDRLANFQYSAPEQRSRGVEVDARADIYALGLLLNEMFTREIPYGTGYKTIGSISPEHVYLDELVSQMRRQSPAERPASINEIKCKLILQRNMFVSRQKQSEFSNIVIKTDEIDDPLINNPPALLCVDDWNNGDLRLILTQSVNPRWDAVLKEVILEPPFGQKWLFTMDHAHPKILVSSNVAEIDAQKAVDFLKRYLPAANNRYKEIVIKQKNEMEEAELQRVRELTEQEQARQRVLQGIRI